MTHSELGVDVITSSGAFFENSVLQADLFQVVKQFVLDSGGDGDGWVISERYMELANLFELYEKEHGGWFTDKYEGPDFISFAHQQESISFVRDRLLLSEYAGDIIVEI